MCIETLESLSLLGLTEHGVKVIVFKEDPVEEVPVTPSTYSLMVLTGNEKRYGYQVVAAWANRLGQELKVEKGMHGDGPDNSAVGLICGLPPPFTIGRLKTATRAAMSFSRFLALPLLNDCKLKP